MHASYEWVTVIQLAWHDFLHHIADWTGACICAGPDTCANGTYSQAFYSYGNPSNAVMRYLCLPVRVRDISSPAPSRGLKHRHAQLQKHKVPWPHACDHICGNRPLQCRHSRPVMLDACHDMPGQDTLQTACGS